jgi:bifunctional non-homologous end joining protein LigD
MRAGRRDVEITHPGKVLFPEDGITKDDLAAYYRDAAARMVPLVRDRPVSLQRFNSGIGGEGFFQKNVAKGVPPWVKRVEVPKKGGSLWHVLANDAATLVWLANQNAITPHVWLSRADRVHQPDRMVVDLDPPPGAGFADVRRAARQAGDLMREIGLEPFAQVTGSKGIHVWTPLRRREDFEEVKNFSNRFAGVLAARHPDELTTEFRKAKRAGRILVDVLRNRYAQTAVPPYAVRPRKGAPVATPIEWDELSDSKLRPDRWTLKNVLRRLGAKGDPWAEIGAAATGLGGPRKRLDAIAES